MGAIYLIPDPARLEESAALAAAWDACFEYNDFYAPRVLEDDGLCRELMDLYRGLDRDRSRDTLHGAFLDVTVHSEDPGIRAVSERRVRQSLEVARALGLRGAVFHTGTIPNYKSPAYTDNWLRRNREFWTDACEGYPELEILMENMFDTEPVLLGALAEELKEVTNFGVCLDYAHTRVFGEKPEAWLAALAPYVRHMHINDNDGRDDLHDGVGDGVIDWELFDRTLRASGAAPTVLIETRPLEKQRRSLAYMRERGVYPFGKEGGGAIC